MSFQKRKDARIKPDLSSYAQVQLQTRPSGIGTREFKPGVLGLISEESSKGCGLVLLATSDLQVGDRCRVKTRKAGPVLAEVRWRTEVDSSVLRIGLMWIE